MAAALAVLLGSAIAFAAASEEVARAVSPAPGVLTAETTTRVGASNCGSNGYSLDGLSGTDIPGGTGTTVREGCRQPHNNTNCNAQSDRCAFPIWVFALCADV